MTAHFSATDLTDAVARISVAADQFASELNAADAQIGDGDLGITLSNGWRAASEKLQAQKPRDVGSTFLMCAQAFQEASASSFGTLTATGLLAAAKLCMGKGEISFTTVGDLLASAEASMAKRGKAQLGDKTVLDALHAMIEATANLSHPVDIRNACATAAGTAVEHFRHQPNKVGRARMFGEDSIGLVDPGMLAVQRMAEAL